MASKAQIFISPPHLPSYSSPSKPRSLRISCCLPIKQSRDGQNSSTNKSLACLRVAFAAGGTGGHIYPAVAIADELKLVHPTSKFIFLGCPNSMESTAIPSARFEFKSIPAVQLARPFFSLRNLLLPYLLIKSIIKCYILLSRFRPHIVIGTGGYVSFPVCLAAFLKGIRVVIQEQNSVPGIANTVLSLFADLVFVAFNSTVESFPRKGKCVVCGNPVRLSLKGSVGKAVSRSHFFPWLERMEGSSEEIKVILVLGGSLGANALNIALLHVYSQLLLEHKNWFIIWQTGVHSFDEMDSLVRSHRQLLLKCVVCGNPVRLSLKGSVGKAVSRSHFFPWLERMEGSSEEIKVILVLGGSLGANALNIALLHVYSQLLLEHKNWFIIWQTGVHSFDEMDSLVRSHRQLLLTPFLHSMEMAYAAADLIVSRAGAMTCSEILATGKPAILVPSPNVAEGHQHRNASLMADVAGSRVITEDELDSTTLRTAISEILGNERLLVDMSKRALKAAKPDASSEIAKHILSLVNLSKVKEKW